MRCLLIHAHPDPDSFSTALRERAVAALGRAGHEVDVIDLYELGYDPCLSETEHVDYYSIGLNHPDQMTADHIESLTRAEMLVFVYPTWWSGLPAIMKGWLDRTLLPDVAFTLTPGSDGNEVVRPNLTNIRRLVGITTYGSKRVEVAVLGDAGKRTITRTVRMVCAKRCRSTWLGLHALDTRSNEERTAFLDQVESKLAGIR
ncbi:MAG: NAD(P)H-dependent oxidoreductase [Acidimicrobiales bacterium]